MAATDLAEARLGVDQSRVVSVVKLDDEPDIALPEADGTSSISTDVAERPIAKITLTYYGFFQEPRQSSPSRKAIKKILALGKPAVPGKRND